MVWVPCRYSTHTHTRARTHAHTRAATAATAAATTQTPNQQKPSWPFADACPIRSYEAYSALRNVDLANPKLKTIAAAHSVSTAQVALKWVVQLGCPVAVSPGLNEAYAVEDLSLARFNLTAADMAAISAI